MEMSENEPQKEPNFPRDINFVDQGVLGILEKYGCATIDQIMALLPDELKRTITNTRIRCRALENKYGYIKSIKKEHKKVYLLTPTGYSEYTGKPASSQKKVGYEELARNWVRVEWAKKQEGIVVTSGFDHKPINGKPATIIIDAIAQNQELDKYLIVDSANPAEFIGQTISRLEDFYTFFESHVQLDLIVFSESRRQKVETFIQGKDWNVVVLYRPL